MNPNHKAALQRGFDIRRLKQIFTPANRTEHVKADVNPAEPKHRGMGRRERLRHLRQVAKGQIKVEDVNVRMHAQEVADAERLKALGLIAPSRRVRDLLK